MHALADNVFIFERPHQTLGGVPFGQRSTIIRLENGDLWLYSPIEFSESELKQIRSLGKIKYIIAPNSYHHNWLEAAVAQFPDALVFGAEALQRKEPTVQMESFWPMQQDFPFDAEIDSIYILGVPKLQEMVFYHRASKTILMADLCMHLCYSQNFFQRWMLKLFGYWMNFGPTILLKKILLNDADKFGQSLKEILKWDVENIVMCHGQIIVQAANDRLEKAFQDWL